MIPELKQIKMQITLFEQGVEKFYEEATKLKEDYLQAVKEVEEGLNFNKGAFPQTVFSYHTDAAINQIIAQLQKEHDWTYKQAKLYLSSGGFTIYTTQNPKVQYIIDEELKKEIEKLKGNDK